MAAMARCFASISTPALAYAPLLIWLLRRLRRHRVRDAFRPRPHDVLANGAHEIGARAPRDEAQATEVRVRPREDEECDIGVERHQQRHPIRKLDDRLYGRTALQFAPQ